MSAGGSGVVDMSGAVSAILRSYQAVLVEYQRLVTGDPAALTTSARRHTEQASCLGGVRDELGNRASGLGSSWQGHAYDAFHQATGRHTTDLGSLASMLRRQSEALMSAASALTSARSTVDSVIAWFDENARMLVQQASTAAVGAAGAFIEAARQLGESAVSAAKASVRQFGAALTASFSPTAGGAHVLSQPGGVR